MKLQMNESKEVNYEVLKTLLSVGEFLLMSHILSQKGMGLRSESLEEIPDLIHKLRVERLVNWGLMSLEPAKEPTPEKSHILRVTRAGAEPVLRYMAEAHDAWRSLETGVPPLL